MQKHPWSDSKLVSLKTQKIYKTGGKRKTLQRGSAVYHIVLLLLLSLSLSLSLSFFLSFSLSPPLSFIHSVTAKVMIVPNIIQRLQAEDNHICGAQHLELYEAEIGFESQMKHSALSCTPCR